MKQSDAIHAKVLEGASRVLNGDDSSAGGSADLDYGHDLISEAFTEFEAAIIARVQDVARHPFTVASAMCESRHPEARRFASLYMGSDGQVRYACVSCKAAVELVIRALPGIIRAD